MNGHSRFAGPRLRHVPTLFVCLLLFSGGGCSKEKLADIATKVKDKGTDLVKESKKMTDSLVEGPVIPEAETGNVSIQTTPQAIEIDQAIARLYVVGDGRKHSLQITSYPPGADKTGSPAIFIQATTDIETIPLLAGKSIPCNVFLEAQGGVIARNPVGKPVDITFGSVNFETNTVTATLPACMLMQADNQPLSVGGGEILAVVQEG